jgi:lysozyme
MESYQRANPQMKNLREMIKRHEGVETHAYKCSQNKTTIGVGRNIDPDGGIGLSEAELDYLLNNDINRCIGELSGFVWFPDLNEARQNAIIDMVFNLGITRFKGFKNAIDAMSKSDFETAADEFYDSRWAKQVGNRAIEICEMIRKG